MIILRILCFATLLACFSCTSDKKAETTTSAPEAAAPVTMAPEDAPRPTGCVFLTDQQVLDALNPQTEATINVQAGPSVSSCYYRVDSRYWSADLIIEVADGTRADALLKEVEEAPAEEKLTVQGLPARMTNENRILKVKTGPPLEIKLSILPKTGYKEVKTAEDRKAIMFKLVELLEEKL